MHVLLLWKLFSPKSTITSFIAVPGINSKTVYNFFSSSKIDKGDPDKEQKPLQKNKTHPDTIKTSVKKTVLFEPPEEPVSCCMSGCANCVWLDYAEKLVQYYQDGGEKAIQEINERVSDSNIKAYLLFEIRIRNKK